jgi:hypothetical protein
VNDTRFGFLLALGLTIGCSATPPPELAAPPATMPPPSAEPSNEVAYSKFTDSYYLTHANERNVYGRRTLARLWVLVATGDTPGAAREARLSEANAALAAAERAVAAQNDPCAAHVAEALERAEATKAQLERQYLQLSQDSGEPSPEAQSLDAQVHLLRDEIEELRTLSEPCPKPLFDAPPETT